MQILYAAPFILISLIGFAVCIVAPQLRQYKFQVLVAPVAFGFCAIVGMGAIVLIGDLVGQVFHMPMFAEPASGAKGVLTFVLIFVAPGLIGSAAAVAIVNRITAHR